MDWLEAVVHTTTMGADIVSEVLMNAGAIGTAIEDRYDVTSSKKSDGMWDMIDEDVLRGKYIGCHPCINTSPLNLSMPEMRAKFLPHLGIEPMRVDLPDVREETDA